VKRAARAMTEELDHIRRGVRGYLELKGRYLAADDERELDDAADWTGHA